ncbi:CGH_1_collapsed_G0006640.mRNA.1.CDS.1 [Saccharomyces cerevisiae]|nr:CGH_3_collapsed_G0006550.mRNA.1.CDS.1 [Saccharomyces cerevisiae]CAI7177054.1 CGH_1_collapsed_G0006640.mRNA.1.CDS.1 [Saccharomyces cerevisiae]
MSTASTPPINLFRRKKEHKRGITYTMLLCGPAGTGKTTFANNLLETKIFPHKYQYGKSNASISSNPEVKVIAPTKVVSFNSKNGIPSYVSEFDPMRANLEPGITITSTSLELGGNKDQGKPEMNEDDTVFFNLIMTHGIGENLDDSLCSEEVMSYLEQQFDIVLAEETRIKRNPRFEDTRVHVALYFIEPTGHGLREVDVELMKSISKYTNVLPIITRADSFTKEELTQFRKNIMFDVERYNVPIYKFEVDPEDDDLESMEENQALASLQPFAIITSDTRDSEGRYVREYPWGIISIDDDKISDLKVLKNVLFGSHLQEFKDTTQNLLYENYRSEKLSSVANTEEIGPNSTKRQSNAPSLSNFASLISTGQFNSSQTLANNLRADTPRNQVSGNFKENEYEDNGEHDSAENEQEMSPVRQLGREIKQENENLIRSIKTESSPKFLNSPDLPERTKLRNISETVPYVLRHERILARQQKLEELEAQSAKELQNRIQELERKAHELKLREKLINQNKLNGSSSSINSLQQSTRSQIKKNDTYTDLASIASGRD